MKSCYTFICKFLVIVFLSSVTITNVKAQLAAGDIAFTGYHATPNSPQSDAFSFILLKAVTSGTVINFTENAWGNNNTFRTGENTVVFTLGANRPAGTEIVISGVPSATTINATLVGGGSAGTCTGNMLSLSVTGDQVLAYQGSAASPTFISAIHMNVYIGGTDPSVTDATNWDNLPSTTQTTNSTFKPSTLTTGTNAIWIGTQGVAASERNNARFNCNTAVAGGADLTTIAGVRAACNNQAFWDAEAAASGATPTWPLPSGCNFVNVLLPVRLISFQAKSNLTNVGVQWKVTNQSNLSHYEIERSFDNKNFDKVGTVAAQSSAGDLTYNYTDADALKSNATVIYYRLKSVDLDGAFTYSEIVSIRNKKGATLSVENMTNPVKNNLNFTLVSKNAGQVQIQLTDINGKILATRSLQVTAGSSTTINLTETAALASGMYLLKLTDGSETVVTKFIK